MAYTGTCTHLHIYTQIKYIYIYLLKKKKKEEDEGWVESVITVNSPDRSGFSAGLPCLAESIRPEADWWDKGQILPEWCGSFIKRG